MIEKKKTAPHEWIEDGMRAIRGIARSGPGCHDTCGIISYVKDGKLVKIEGDPENPKSQGRLCSRCLAMPDVINHPDRLLYPMKRAREDRGKDIWERITWDEAYDIIVGEWNKIREEYGPESICVLQGTGRDISPQIWALCYGGIGTPNWTYGFLSGNACYIPRQSAMALMSGAFMQVADCSQFLTDRYDDPQYKVPEYILLWGNNCVWSNSDDFLGHWIVDLMKRGSRLINVDPRVTWLAAHSELWLPIRPGTDCALALAMVNHVVAEDLYDHEFVDCWCAGFDELVEHIKEYTPEWAAEITWISEEKIKEAARLYATAKPGMLQWGLKVDQTTNGFETAHAIAILWSICGNIDRPGTQIIAAPLAKRMAAMPHLDINELSPEVQKKRIGLSEYPMYGYGFTCYNNEMFAEQIVSGEPYPIKSCYLQTNNPIACMGAQAHRVHELLSSIEFNVCADLFMTPSAMAFADVVLPASMFPERYIETGYIAYSCGTIYSDPVVEAAGEARSDWRINTELAARLNPDPEAWPWKSEDEMFRWGLRALDDEEFEELRQRGWYKPEFEYEKYRKGLLRADGNLGFNTYSGRIELGFNPLKSIGLKYPRYWEPEESPVSTPELFEEYPLILMTGARQPVFFHSEHRQIGKLRQKYPEPRVEINPKTAAELNIADGEMVAIENHRGMCKQRAKFSKGIAEGQVMADHGWWYPERDPEKLFDTFESNPNNLTELKCGPSGFGAAYNGLLCRVRKLTPEEAEETTNVTLQ